jgi:hypothetical protein
VLHYRAIAPGFPSLSVSDKPSPNDYTPSSHAEAVDDPPATLGLSGVHERARGIAVQEQHRGATPF